LDAIKQETTRRLVFDLSKEIVAFADRSELLPEYTRVHEVHDVMVIAFHVQIKRNQVRHLYECYVLIEQYFCQMDFPLLEYCGLHISSPWSMVSSPN